MWDIVGFLCGCLLLFIIIHGIGDGFYYQNPLLYSILFVVSLVGYLVSSKMVDKKKINDKNSNNE